MQSAKQVRKKQKDFLEWEEAVNVCVTAHKTYWKGLQKYCEGMRNELKKCLISTFKIILPPE